MLIDVRDHGAIGDGVHDDTHAIQAALTLVARQGGGKVVVPVGRYCCQTLQLGSRVTLDLDTAAALLYVGDHTQPLIRIDDCEGVTLCGGGLLDGLASAPEPPGTAAIRYPAPAPLIEVRDSADIRIMDINVHRAAAVSIFGFRCDRLWLRGVSVVSDRGWSDGDGVSVNGCREVFISDCYIDAGGSAITLATSNDARSCEQVVIRGNSLRSEVCGIVCGPDSWHPMRHITISDCVIRGANRGVAVYAFDGGAIEYLTISNLICETNCPAILNAPIHLDARQRTPQSRRSRIHQVSVRGLSARTDGRLLFTAANECEISQISLVDLQLDYPLFCDPQIVAVDALSATCSLYSPQARAARAAIVADGIDDFQVRGVQIRWPDGHQCPGWCGGEERRESGGNRRFGRADHGDAVDFQVFYGRGLVDCRIDIGGLIASDGGLDPVTVINSDGTVLILDDG